MGVDKCLEVMDDVGGCAVIVIGMVKDGKIGIGSIGKLMDLMKHANELIKDIPDALPEMQDLDAAEVGKLGAAGFMMVKKIIAAVKQ